MCNPHNPTGSPLLPASIERILDQSERHGATLDVDVDVDEAYMDYVEDPCALAGARWCCARFKAWGMAARRACRGAAA